MASKSLSIALALAAGLVRARSGPSDIKQTHNQIQAQYNRWSKAYMARDVATLLDILSPTYTLTSVDKDVLDYKTYKAYLQLKQKGPKDSIVYGTRILQLVQDGAIATVKSEESMSTRKPDSKGRIIVSLHKHVYTDTWTLTGKTWHLQSTVTQKESTAVSTAGSSRPL